MQIVTQNQSFGIILDSKMNVDKTEHATGHEKAFHIPK